jgi:N-acetylglutamate synthase-like GNAT family acetyltransferase
VLPAKLHVRRATVDDLPALQSLWASMRINADGLESRLTEFQIVEADQTFAGAIGVQLIRTAARLHSEGFTDFAIADAARQLFWERILTLAANHGVFRIWTQETSPFWTHWGFQPANAETLQRLPEEWKDLEGRWLTLELKNEDAINAALKNQFASFMDDEKKQTASVSQKARTLNTIITAIGFAIGIICFGAAIYLFIRRNPFSR